MCRGCARSCATADRRMCDMIRRVNLSRSLCFGAAGRKMRAYVSVFRPFSSIQGRANLQTTVCSLSCTFGAGIQMAHRKSTEQRRLNSEILVSILEMLQNLSFLGKLTAKNSCQLKLQTQRNQQRTLSVEVNTTVGGGERRGKPKG
eukprot:1183001-Prorocentrum_minimum.AAC.6